MTVGIAFTHFLTYTYIIKTLTQSRFKYETGFQENDMFTWYNMHN